MNRFLARINALAAGERVFHFWVALGLIAGCSCFWSQAGASHFDYDDYVLIVENPPIRDLSGLSTVLSSGRPLRGLSLMLDYALFGLDPRGYHLDNVFWHFAGALSFYFLVLRLFRERRLAAMAALIFVLHPVHTEAVMGIAHRKEMLAFTFMTLSYQAYLYRGSRFWSLVGSAVFFILALASKQVALALPLLILAQAGLEKGKFPDRPKLIQVGILALVVAVLLAGGLWVSGPVLRDFNLFGRIAPSEVLALGYSRVLATSFSTFPRYLQLLLFPVHLCLDRQVLPVGLSSPRAWLGMIMFVGLLVAAFRLRRDQLLSFSLLWIIINLLPVMNWFPANAFFAERYLYIPSAGYCLLLAHVWNRLYLRKEDLFGGGGYRRARYLLAASLVFLILAVPLTLRLYVLWPPETKYFFDPAPGLLLSILAAGILGGLLLWIMDRGPWSGFLSRHLSVEFAAAFGFIVLIFIFAAVLMEVLVHHRWGLPQVDVLGSFSEMREWLKGHARPGPRVGGALLYPSGTPGAELFDIVLHGFGSPSLVILLFRRLARGGRKFSLSRGLSWELGCLLILALDTGAALRTGDWSSGVRLWRSTVLEEPKSVTGWNNLGQAYMDRFKYRLAAESFQEAVRLKPEMADTHRNLGMALLAGGDFKSAAAAYTRALGLNPHDLDSRIQLANILVTQADRKIAPDGYKLAIPHYLQVISLDPNSAHAYHNLAYCYYRLGAFDQARAALSRALAISPNSPKSIELWNMIEEKEESQK